MILFFLNPEQGQNISKKMISAGGSTFFNHPEMCWSEGVRGSKTIENNILHVKGSKYTLTATYLAGTRTNNVLARCISCIYFLLTKKGIHG